MDGGERVGVVARAERSPAGRPGRGRAGRRRRHEPVPAAPAGAPLLLALALCASIALAGKSACPTRMAAGMETWCIMETTGASDECEMEESTPGLFFPCRGQVGLYDGDNACWRSGRDCLTCDCEDEFSEDDSACNAVAVSSHSVGSCGPLSMGGGDGGGADEECRQSFKMKVCTWQCAFQGDGFVGAVCTDRGYGEPNGGPRPDLNTRPCEENPLTEGEPYLCNTRIPGLEKPRYEGYEPDDLNVTLLDCPEDTGGSAHVYESMADYVETAIAYYERFERFYASLERDLANVHGAAHRQCSLCNDSIRGFNAKYGGCGLNVTIGELPETSTCFRTAKSACRDKGLCVGGSDGASSCAALCDALPCNYGDNCETHGVPRKPVGEVHECWANEYFCGDDGALGSPTDHGGLKGCDTGLDGVNTEGKPCCCVRPCINEEFDPYAFMNAGCYRPNHIIAEAWRTLETKPARDSRPSPAKVRGCAHELADLHDVCELDEVNGTRLREYDPGRYSWPAPTREGHHSAHTAADFARYRPPASQEEEDRRSYRTPCEVDAQLDRILDYLRNMLRQLPLMRAQLEAVRAKYQGGVEAGATSALVAGHLAELGAIARRIERFEAAGARPDRIASADEFQSEATDALLFLQNERLLADLTALRHNHPTEVSKLCSDVEVQDVHFPAGTNDHLKYKTGREPPGADPHRQWAVFCRNLNVKECGRRPEDLRPGPLPQPPQPRPPVPGCGGYRGGCLPHEPAIADIKDINMDEWAQEHLDTLAVIRRTDVRDVFVDTLGCLVHQVPPVSPCEEPCRRCHGTSVAHCHAQLGICVCRLGSERRVIGVGCAPALGEAERAPLQACCEEMFADIASAGAASAPGTGPAGAAEGTGCPAGVAGCTGAGECAAPWGALESGPLLDLCQTTGSETGMCCTYGLEERPVLLGCTGGASCREACRARFGRAQAFVEGCARRCAATDVSCERRCVAEALDAREARRCIGRCWGEERHWPEGTLDCLLACPPDGRVPRSQEVCQRMCKALAPELVVRVASLRGSSEVAAIYAGEGVRFRTWVENRGLLPFSGRAEVRLALLDGCDCPPCPAGAVCECECEERYGALLATIPVPIIEPGASSTLLSDRKTVGPELVGRLVQPAAALVGDDGQAAGAGRGPVSKVLAMGAVAVVDAWFTSDGERATQAYAGSRVKGFVEVRSERFPLTVDLYMVDPEGREVGGSRGTVLVEDVLNGTRFDTLEVSTPPSYVGFVLRLRVEARDGTNATVLAATLSEQGLPSGACSGEALTTACIEQAGGFASDYPDAFLEVRRPELRLEEAAFETLQGQPSPVLYGPEEARASVVLESLAAIPFNGTVTVAALDSWSLAVGGSVRSANASLGRGQRARFGSAPFPAAPPNAYTILVQARDSAGREWAVTPTASGLVGVEAFPLSRLEARERGLVQGESVYIDQTIEHSGCRVRVSCEDCLPTCTLWLDRRACTVRADPGTCACECVAEAG